MIDNDGESTSRSKTVAIANRLPTANFDFSPAAPKKNETVTFTSLASDPENRIQMLEWDLDGDNQYDDAFGPTAQKAFDSPGYQDRAPQGHRQRRRIAHRRRRRSTVASQPPAASFVFSPATPLSSAERVVFTSTSSDPDGSIADVRWDTDNDGVVR